MFNSGSASNINNQLLIPLAGPRQNVASGVPAAVNSGVYARPAAGSSESDQPDVEIKDSTPRTPQLDDENYSNNNQVPNNNIASGVNQQPPASLLPLPDLPNLPTYEYKEQLQYAPSGYEECCICQQKSYCAGTGGKHCTTRNCSAKICKVCTEDHADENLCPLCKQPRLMASAVIMTSTSSVDPNLLHTLRIEASHISAKLIASRIAVLPISAYHLEQRLNKFRAAVLQAINFRNNNRHDPRAPQLVWNAQTQLGKAEADLVPKIQMIKRYFELYKTMKKLESVVAAEDKNCVRLSRMAKKAAAAEYQAKRRNMISVIGSCESLVECDYAVAQQQTGLINGDGYVSGVYLGNGQS